MSLIVRPASPEDAECIYDFILQLAIYEREPDAVEATPDSLRAQLQQAHPPFECLIAELDGAPAGVALFFSNYSTWKGKPGLYLEDLFVPTEHRGQGIGKALLKSLARIATERDYARMEWSVLDWNEPAIRFYETLGAQPMSEWTTFRLTGGPLKTLATKP